MVSEVNQSDTARARGFKAVNKTRTDWTVMVHRTNRLDAHALVLG